MRKSRLAALIAAPAMLAGAAVAQQDPGTTVKATHGDWTVVCAKNDAKACLIGQTGTNEKSEPVLQVQIRKTPGAKAPNGQAIDGLLELIAPIGVFLPAGIAIKIDGKEIGRAGYEFCNPEACVVAQPIQNQFISQMKAGSNAVMTLTARNGSTANVTISLKGFTKAFNTL